MDVEAVRLILERTFQMPVAESDAQIILDRLAEIFGQERFPTQYRRCPACNTLLEEHSVYCDTCGTDTPRQ